MRKVLCRLAPLSLAVVTACGPAPDVHSTRSGTSLMSLSPQDQYADEQSATLAELSRRIVVQTTLKGAGVGAALGCGVAVVSAGNARNCLVGAASGALGGALVGNAIGKKKVERQIDSVSPSAVVRTLRKANAQMALVQSSLPERLAAQDNALAQLDLQHASKAISTQQYVRARAAIRSERSEMALALIETENNATRAANNLRDARNEGQGGLDWHISASENLARTASSARSDISLL